MKAQLSFTTLLLCGLCAGAAADVRVCPPWQLEVLDDKGVPIGDCKVVQEWSCNFGAVCPIQTTNALTDAEGRVSFPERWMSKPTTNSLLKKISGVFRSKEEPNPAANLYIWKHGYEAARIYSERDANVVATAAGLRSKITLRPEAAAK